MFNDQKTYLKFVYITSDLICLAILFYLIIPLFLPGINGYFFSIHLEPTLCNSFYKACLFVFLYPLSMFIPLVLMLVFKAYNNIDYPDILRGCYQSFVLCVLAIAGILFVSFLCFDLISKEILCFSAISGSVLFLMLTLNRIYIFYLIKNGSSNSNLIKYLLLVGTGSNAQSIATYIENHPKSGLRVTGFLTDKDDEIGQTILNNKIVGKVEHLTRVVSEHYTDCVLYAGDKEFATYYKPITESCRIMGIDFAATEIELDNPAIKNKHIFSEKIGDIELKLIKFVYISPLSSFLKRMFDFTASSTLIMFCLPIWILISVLIKLTSPGPAFFRQERIGKHGKKFILFKFRSMVDGAENMQESLMHLNEMDGPAFKIKNDPRQTRIGKFLRRSSLDELPQLFNVMKGDISLVGPRPAIEKEVIRYQPNERKRLSLMQGITCIWQVSGRNKIKFDEWMKLDLMYIDTWSQAQDFKILFKTIPAVLLKKGAT